MHRPEATEVDTGTDDSDRVNGIDFLWLELTNRCNLQCVHCYTQSHPDSGEKDLLSGRNYESIMRQAFGLGCRKIQLIGGEPQLNRDFKSLLRAAKDIGFDFIEVFSNLSWLDDETLDYSAANGICYATSVYSDDPAAHDAVTKVAMSHTRTIGNLKRLIARGVTTRAAVIVIDQDQEEVERTRQFLHGLGVGSLRVGAVREFGRGEQLLSRSARLSGLCGHCWKGKLAVAPDGTVYPCVMARQWPVGNIFRSRLSEIVEGEALKSTRRTILDSVWLPTIRGSGCTPTCPQSCNPDVCPQNCSPDACPQACHPDGCAPNIGCGPVLPQ